MNVLITGGSRGIGLACARQLLRAGHQVTILSKNAQNLAAARASLDRGGMVDTIVCDVARPDDIQAAAATFRSRGLGLDALVLNAGIFVDGNLASGSRDNLLAALNINLMALLSFTQAFVDDLARATKPRIVVIGSTAAIEPCPLGPLYGISKYAVRGFAVNLRRELMPRGIGVTLINPGGTLTDMWDGDGIPPGRLLEPDDVGKMVMAVLELSAQAVVEEIVMRPLAGEMA